MPRAKTALKSSTEADGTGSRLHQSPTDTVEMKDLELVADIGGEEGKEPSKEKELPNNIADMSVDANTTKSEQEDSSLPRKPKRLFANAGIKKKDAKPKQSAVKADNNKQSKASSPDVDTPQNEQSIKPESEKKPAKKKKNICQSYKPQFFDDDHPYEDPSLLVNNSTAMNEHNPDLAVKPSMEERATSPTSVKTSVGKSNESIKAGVKDAKEKHVSIMSETSIPRSIFATLVAFLLSLIVFLAIYFLLHRHALLSIAVAIVVLVIIMVTLGFMDGRRMKCWILLALPSVFSRGGRLALYLMLGYFVITGPLCNMIGNVKTVRNSIKCMNNERPEVIQETMKTFEALERCITNKQLFLIKENKSINFACLQQRCHSVKDRFDYSCQLENNNISPTACNMSQELSCVNKTTYPRDTDGCPKKFLEKYCEKEFHKVLEFLDEDTSDDDGRGFLEILSMLFPLLILFVLYEGYNYENNYRTYNNFHNFFLTGHFQVIDQSRSSCDREAVLPLRKVELRKHVRPATVCNLTDIEKKQLWNNMKTYMIVLLIALFIILADLYMFRMFDVKNDGKVGLEVDIVSTNNSVHFQTLNTTVVSNNKTKSTNSSKEVNATTGDAGNVNATSLPTRLRDDKLLTVTENTHICSAIFDAPGSTSKIILPLILTLLLLVILLQAQVSRIQWYICSRLYEMREKERVFYLYNKILEDRVQLVEKCRQRMKCYHREMKTRNSLEITRILAQQVRWLSKIFKFFHINLRRCIICNDTEKPEFKICHGLDCSGVYCLTCSFDIDKKCLYCDTELKHSLSLKQADDISSKESLV